jgi:hypothetical protein
MAYQAKLVRTLRNQAAAAAAAAPAVMAEMTDPFAALLQPHDHAESHVEAAG